MSRNLTVAGGNKEAGESSPGRRTVLQRHRDIKLHGVFKVIRNGIPAFAWGSGEK